MDAKPGSSSQGPAAEPGATDGSDGTAERYGPLQVLRMRKDDGRQLIAYSRAEPADGGSGAPER
jgi:hypothetical protein